MPVLETPGLQSQRQSSATWPSLGRISLPAVTFTILWPTFNLCYLVAIQLELGVLNPNLLIGTALKLYFVFTTAYLIIRALQHRFPVALAPTRLWKQLILHLAVIGTLGVLLAPSSPRPIPENYPQVNLIPLTMFVLQVVCYVVTTSMLAYREQSNASTLTLRQAQINLLRSQSNPHFLFNTLNLLASEILSRPESAREIVYDLADLLRESMSAGDRVQISIGDELRLVELYLRLQEKRFPDRFSFAIEIEPGCADIQVPALLLQPAVENVIKHAVAKTSSPVELSITVNRIGDRVAFVIRDNGPAGGMVPVEEGAGFRILRETLSLHYPGQHDFAFSVSAGGATLKIEVPVLDSLPLAEKVVV